MRELSRATHARYNVSVMTGDHDPEGVVRVRARNPSPLTLDGTNSYVVGRWVVDPGPADPAHLDALEQAAEGAVEGIVLTHGHADHAAGAEPLARRAGGVPVKLPRDGERIGPFEAIATPGHSPDHVCLLLSRTCFTGDAVLGVGSVVIGPAGPGEPAALPAYLDSLRRLRALELDVLCPGHGPYVPEPRAKLDEYLEHRLERERRLLSALDSGLRTHDELLDSAWADAPRALRPAAGLALEAHLEKLAEEGRLPEDVERRAPGVFAA